MEMVMEMESRKQRRRKFFMTHLRNDMSENYSGHTDMVADSVGSDTCHYSWVVRVLDMTFNSSKAVVIFSAGKTCLGLMLILKCWKLKQKYQQRSAECVDSAVRAVYNKTTHGVKAWT